MQGVHPGRLGSIKDSTLRKMHSKHKNRESLKLISQLAASLNNGDSVNEYYRKYLDSLWHENITENRNREMREEYEKYVRNVSPVISRDSEGNAIVRGLTNV